MGWDFNMIARPEAESNGIKRLTRHIGREKGVGVDGHKRNKF
jgi:hypothetical protein